MKAMYYHPQKVSACSLSILAITSVMIIAVVEWGPQPNSAPLHATMTKAATTADAGFQAIKATSFGTGNSHAEHPRSCGNRNAGSLHVTGD